MPDLHEQFGGIDIYLFDQLQRRRLLKGMRVFDIGCGSGRNLVYLLQSGYEVFGIDPDPHAIQSVRQLVSRLAPHLPAENFRVETAERTSFPDAFADAVLCSAVLHFASDDAQFAAMVGGAWKALAPGGLLFCRLASSIGMEQQVRPVAGRRHRLPDGSERYLVDEALLMGLTRDMGGELLDPLKTTIVQNQRCMTTWVVRKTELEFSRRPTAVEAIQRDTDALGFTMASEPRTVGGAMTGSPAGSDCPMPSSGFEAVAGSDARVLILGTLPGAASLACGQYYAQPRNAFWKIMGELVGAAPALPYADRLRCLVARRVALWDVCAVAARRGSADAAIQSAAVLPNDFSGFLRSHPSVELICFNGAKAGELFRRHVSATLESPGGAIRQAFLPSTSPAHAAMPFERKLAAWRVALSGVPGTVDFS
jgi:hypoxanthine-DNA glycosylase